MSRVPIPPAGTTTGRVTVGRYTLHVGAPAGTIIEAVPEPASGEDDRLALALDEQGVGPAPAPERIESAVESAADVTGRVERALELFQEVATARVLAPDFLMKELDAGIDLLRRLDRADRFEDALRLARALAGVLTLLGRWAAVVQTLRIALRAASAHANTTARSSAEAWVRNELGTLAAGAGRDASAQRLLRESLRLREQAGEELGTAVTRHNLKTSSVPPSSTFIRRVATRLGIAAGAGIALTIGLLFIGSDEQQVGSVPPPAVEITSGPPERTRATTATFEFRAVPRADRFECRVDQGAFEACASPERLSVRLRPGPHAFQVRAIGADDAPGEEAEHAWRVVARDDGDRTPPTVKITDGPDERTKSPTASFEFEADERVRGYECSVDEAPFRTCTSPHPVAGPLSSGVHRFDVRAVDLARNVGKAPRYRWRVLPSVGPTVEFTVTPEALTNIRAARFAYTAPGAARFECELDGGEPAACGNRTAYKRLKEGEHMFSVRAFDGDGTAGPPATWTWVLDTTAPRVTAIRELSATDPDSTSFLLESDDTMPTFECTLSYKEPFEECTSPASFPGRPALLVVRATDAAGNVGEPSEWRRPAPPR